MFVCGGRSVPGAPVLGRDDGVENGLLIIDNLFPVSLASILRQAIPKEHNSEINRRQNTKKGDKETGKHDSTWRQRGNG